MEDEKMDFDYRLLAKYIIDELSESELEEVVEWRGLSEENRKIFSEVVKLRISWKYTRYNTPVRIEEALGKINDKINRTSRLRLVFPVLKYAAVALLLISLSYMGVSYFKPETYVTFTVKDGENVKKFILADGTSVWLKSGSSLKVPETFSSDKRNLSLQGEAFFDVAKNASSPLYVSTDYVNVKVIGTAFNVKTDKARRNVETVLARGKIALLDKQWNPVLDMSPGEKVTYDSRQKEYITEIVDVNVSTAWRLNQFVFENVTLREIVNQLSAKFNVNINLESSELAARRFRCVVNEDESLSDILELLKYLAPIRYRIEGKEVFIYMNNEKGMPMVDK